MHIGQVIADLLGRLVVDEGSPQLAEGFIDGLVGSQALRDYQVLYSLAGPRYLESTIVAPPEAFLGPQELGLTPDQYATLSLGASICAFVGATGHQYHGRVVEIRRQAGHITRLVVRCALHEEGEESPPLPGMICEHCFDAPASRVVPAPWGGEMGICADCQGR